MKSVVEWVKVTDTFRIKLWTEDGQVWVRMIADVLKRDELFSFTPEVAENLATSIAGLVNGLSRTA